MRIGPWEIGIILLVVMIIFGVGKLSDVGKHLGKGIRDFKKYSQGGEDEDEKLSVGKTEDVKSELELTKAKLEATEVRLKALEESTKKTQ
jgi:sec-independent protein translocase protein TatA